MIKIYTDGSTIKQNGPSGFAFVIIFESGEEWHYSEGVKNSTNNRVEMLAVIEALKFLDKGVECKIFSDSKLVINCASNIWKRKANLDLWKEYDNVSQGIKINFEWVKGHNGDTYNEIVDKMALSEARDIQNSL